jgi:hypothetical protein
MMREVNAMRSATWPVLLLLAASPRAVFATSSPQGDPPPAPAATPEYRVAVWYDRARPLDSFRYQVYDLRKGEYTRAVDDWVALLQARFPGYEVRVRDVFLAREKGATEKLRVGSVLNRELLAAAASEGIVPGESLRPRGIERPDAVLRLLPRMPGPRLLPGLVSSGRIDHGPPPPSFPVPVPYPRPHP